MADRAEAAPATHEDRLQTPPPLSAEVVPLSGGGVWRRSSWVAGAASARSAIAAPRVLGRIAVPAARGGAAQYLADPLALPAGQRRPGGDDLAYPPARGGLPLGLAAGHEASATGWAVHRSSTGTR